MYIETFEKSKMSKEGYQYTPLDPNRTEVHSPMIMSRLPFTLLYSPKYEKKNTAKIYLIKTHLKRIKLRDLSSVSLQLKT